MQDLSLDKVRVTSFLPADFLASLNGDQLFSFRRSLALL
jgi:hypothetical protein